MCVVGRPVCSLYTLASVRLIFIICICVLCGANGPARTLSGGRLLSGWSHSSQHCALCACVLKLGSTLSLDPCSRTKQCQTLLSSRIQMCVAQFFCARLASARTTLGADTADRHYLGLFAALVPSSTHAQEECVPLSESRSLKEEAEEAGEEASQGSPVVLLELSTRHRCTSQAYILVSRRPVVREFIKRTGARSLLSESKPIRGERERGRERERELTWS